MAAKPRATSFQDGAEQQYEQLLASIDGIVWEVDTHTWQFTFVSQHAERLLGYPLPQWLTPSFWVDRLHPVDRDWVLECYEQVIREKRNHDFQYRMIAADGRIIWLRDLVSVIVEENETVKLRGVMVDITDYKRTEEMLHGSEARFRALIENSWDAITLVSAEGKLLYSGPTVERLWGYSPDEYAGATGFELVHPDDLAQVLAQFAQMAQKPGGIVTTQYRIRHKDGSWHWIEGVAHNLLHEPSVQAIVVNARDITEQRQAEDELRASEARFRTFVDHATDAFFLHDDQGTILAVNRQACESLGYTREELVGMAPAVFDIDAVLNFREQFGARLAAGEVIAFDTHHRHKDGTVFPVEVRIRPFLQGGRRLAVSLVRDITERKQAERALVESHNLLNAIVEGSSDAIFVKDLEGRYLMINSAGARFLNKTVEQVIGKDDRALFTPKTAQAIRERDHQVMASGESHVFDEPATAAGVTRTYLSTKGVYHDAQGQVIGLIGISRDVTEQKRLEEQFRQAQKMEAVGRLAGGVAHDFNNLLTAMTGYADLAIDALEPQTSVRADVEEIRRAADRATTLTRQLLAFARKQVIDPQVVNLNMLVLEMDKLIRRVIGEDIELLTRLAPDLGQIKADPGQIEQVIVNLAVNARDAMPMGGKLTIETSNVVLDQEYARTHLSVIPGNYILLAISDTGSGMDVVVQQHLFEPFFTTKAPGKGTGLGLATCYGIVQQHGGYIWVYSEVGLGTTMKIYLPHTDEVAAQPSPDAGIQDWPRGTETILLVEDESAVRELMTRLLRGQGYTVLEATNGLEALQIAATHSPGTFQLLLTDVVMPQLGGTALRDQLTLQFPALKVLFISGYTDNAIVHHGQLDAGMEFLPKPFTPSALIRKVRQVLDS